jgi:hypothetical protein
VAPEGRAGSVRRATRARRLTSAVGAIAGRHTPAAMTRVAATLAGVCLALAAPHAHAQDTAPLPADLDRFYSSPSLIGTAPRSVAWSPDARRFAFLWNTEGTNFLDVYVATVSASGAVTPLRATAMPRPGVPAAERVVDGTPIGYTMWRAQRAALAAELDGGVSAFAWHPDGDRLLLTFRGDLWLVELPQAGAAPRTPRRLTETRGSESRAAFAPVPATAARAARRPAPRAGAAGAAGPASTLAFIRDGELHVAPLLGDSLGEARQLTRVAREGVGIEAFAWSRDGARAHGRGDRPHRDPHARHRRLPGRRGRHAAGATGDARRAVRDAARRAGRHRRGARSPGSRWAATASTSSTAGSGHPTARSSCWT